MSGELLIHAFWGGKVDTSGETWVLDEYVTLRFDAGIYLNDEWLEWDNIYDDIEGAFKDYLRDLMRRCAAITVANAHKSLSAVLSMPLIIWNLRELRDGSLLTQAYELLVGAGVGMTSVRDYVGYLRRWFVWAAEGDYGFDVDEAAVYESMVIKGHETGRAVLRQDPDSGPLSETEYARVATAFWRAADEGTLPLPQTCAILLLLNLGCNPENLRRLRREDLIRPGRRGGGYALMVPRIKKRLANKRGDFMRRPLVPDLGALLAQLVDADVAARGMDDDRLFQRHSPEGAVERLSMEFFRRALDVASSRLGLRSDAGAPLRLSPRRLRYTFASRQVALGTTPEQLMVLLDHSNLSTLMVYFDGRLGAVERLDAALGRPLSQVAGAYLARATPSWSPRPKPSDLGVAPLACLDCVRFRPTDADGLRTIAAALSAEVSAFSLRHPGLPVEAHLDACARAALSASACEAVAGPRSRRRTGGRAPDVLKEGGHGR